MSKSKGKGKAPAKKPKKSAEQIASDKRYGVDKAPKKGLSSTKKIKTDVKTGYIAAKKSAGKVSGRTRIGDVPDALSIYKGR